MTRKRWWWLGLSVVASAVVGERLVFAWQQRAWLTRRRGEGSASGAKLITPQPGDILLFHHVARLRDVLITMVTHSPFYHAALYAGNQHAVEARPQGVICNELWGREHNYVVLPAPEGKGEAALAWAKGQLGAKFDRLDLLVIFLEHLLTHWHINYTPHDKYTCAELVATAFDHAGVRLVPDKALDEIAPADLARLLPPTSLPHD
jgi:uncharacterized protein YycO